MITALYQQTGSLQRAVRIAADLLQLKGQVLAASEVPATLCARFYDGSTVRGESQISAVGKRIEKIWLEPEDIPPSDGVLQTIGAADVIVFAPGSLFTSLLPNLLIANVADSIRRSSAIKVLVCNLMTQPGETDEFSACDHIRAVQGRLGAEAIDFCVVNVSAMPAGAARYRKAGSLPVKVNVQEIAALGVTSLESRRFHCDGEKIRHNPAELARLILGAARGQAQILRARAA